LILGNTLSNLNASNLTFGIVDSALILGNTLSNLNASNLTFGIVDSALILGNTLSNLNASNLTFGIVDSALILGNTLSNIQVSNITGIVSGNVLSNLNASNLTFGIVDSALILGNTLSNLNASNLAFGIVDSALILGNTLSNLNASNLAFGIVDSALILGNTLSNITGSNVTGNVANATVALVVSQAAQPNITSVGLLTNLAVSNSLTTSNISVTGNLNVQGTANIFVANIANIYTTNIVGFIGSQWTTGTGNVYYLGNVGIGTSEVSANLTVVGNIYASNSLTTTNLFANTLTLANAASTINVIGSVTASTFYGAHAGANTGSFSDLTTTNVFATTANVSTLNVATVSNLANLVVSNSVTAANIFASKGLDVGPGILGTNVVVFSNISGGANTFVMDANGRVSIGAGSFGGGSLLSFGKTVANKIITLYDGNPATGPGSATGFFGFGINSGFLRYQVSSTGDGHIFYGASSEYARITSTGISILTGAAPTANLHVQGNIFASNALQTTNVLSSNINVSYTANIANLIITSNILPGPSGNTYVTGNLVVSGNVFSSLGTPLGEGGSLYYSLASNYTPPVYTGALYGQALALNLGAFNEQGSSSLVSRSVNGNFRFSKPGVYNLRAIFLTNGNNVIGIGIGSNASDTTTRTDQTYVYRYTTFVTQNPTEVFDIQFYAGSPTDYYYVDLFAVDAPTLMPTSDPLGGTWLSMGPLQGSGGSGPPVTISTLGAVVTGRTTSYGAGVGDYYIGMSNGQTVNLPIGSSLTAGKQYIIKDESGLAGTFVGYRVTIAASAPDLIDGQDSVILALNYGAINVIWTGSFWSIY
jgi:hypothetical protein